MELFPPHNKVFHLAVLAPFGFLVYLSPYQAPEACFLFKPGRSLNSSFPSELPAILFCVLQTPGCSSSPRVNHLQVSSGQGWSWVGLSGTQTLWGNCYCSVAKSWPTLCDLMSCEPEGPGGLLSVSLRRVGHRWSDLATAAAAGFAVLHCLPEFARTHVHWVSDAGKIGRK